MNIRVHGLCGGEMGRVPYGGDSVIAGVSDVSRLDSSGNMALGTLLMCSNASHGHLNMPEACPNGPLDCIYR